MRDSWEIGRPRWWHRQFCRCPRLVSNSSNRTPMPQENWPTLRAYPDLRFLRLHRARGDVPLNPVQLQEAALSPPTSHLVAIRLIPRRERSFAGVTGRNEARCAEKASAGRPRQKARDEHTRLLAQQFDDRFQKIIELFRSRLAERLSVYRNAQGSCLL